MKTVEKQLRDALASYINKDFDEVWAKFCFHGNIDPDDRSVAESFYALGIMRTALGLDRTLQAIEDQ